MWIWFALVVGCSSSKDPTTGAVDTDPTGAVDDTGAPGDDTDATDDTGGAPDDTGSVDDTATDDTGDDEPFDASAYDGSYAGAFVLEVTGVTLPVTDTCTGTIAFTAEAGEIIGSGSCIFTEDGVAASLGVAGPWDGTLVGFMHALDEVEGAITIDILGEEYTEAWTGAFEESVLNATFTGDIEYSGLEFTYEGSFTGSPE